MHQGFCCPGTVVCRWVYCTAQAHYSINALRCQEAGSGSSSRVISTEIFWSYEGQKFEKLRLLFEVRYDDKRPGAEPLADVYYDALYLGD